MSGSLIIHDYFYAVMSKPSRRPNREASKAEKKAIKKDKKNCRHTPEEREAYNSMFQFYCLGKTKKNS